MPTIGNTFNVLTAHNITGTPKVRTVGENDYIFGTNQRTGKDRWFLNR